MLLALYSTHERLFIICRCRMCGFLDICMLWHVLHGLRGNFENLLLLYLQSNHPSTTVFLSHILLTCTCTLTDILDKQTIKPTKKCNTYQNITNILNNLAFKTVVFKTFFLLCVAVNTHSVQRFPGKETERDDFRLLLTEDDSMLVAGR